MKQELILYLELVIAVREKFLSAAKSESPDTKRLYEDLVYLYTVLPAENLIKTLEDKDAA